GLLITGVGFTAGTTEVAAGVGSGFCTAGSGVDGEVAEREVVPQALSASIQKHKQNNFFSVYIRSISSD
ncbi:MAG TPA: hypothetical protein VII61_12615, partial [Ktedonobacteraceae bacterium]